MKKIRVVLSIICMFVFFVSFCKLFRYVLNDDTKSYTRVMMHEMYHQEENIDTLFIGASHCYRGVNPEIMDTALGVNTFNAGTSAQDMDATYVLLKEVAKNHDLQQVYLEVSWNRTQEGDYKARRWMTSTYIIADYMRPSLDKVKFLLDASTSDFYGNSFIVARRDRDNLFDPEHIGEVLKSKASDEYKNYSYVTAKTESYMGKGYVAGHTSVEDGIFFSESYGWDEYQVEAISEDWITELNKIIDFCKAEGIELTLFHTPASPMAVTGMGNYDDFIDFVNDLAESGGIRYYDFNLCKEEYFPIVSDYFTDETHLNGVGADVFSNLFAKLIMGEIAETEMFYESYQAKMADAPFHVYGLSYNNETAEDGTAIRNVKIVSNREEGLEYKISLKPKKGDEYQVQDFMENIYFTILPDEHGVCTIEYRMNNAPEEMKTVEIPY